MNSFTVYDVDLVNAPLFHLYFEGGNGLTVWGVRIKTPATARNTDGIDPDSATNVTVNDSYIQDGDDGVASRRNSAAASNMTIENSHFYGTHGISVGSQTQYGVTNILVENDTVSGTDSSGNVSSDNNGLRIKSHSSEGGTGQRGHLRQQLPDRRQAPLEFNPFYSSGNGSTTPYYTNIVVNGLRRSARHPAPSPCWRATTHPPARPDPGERQPRRDQHLGRVRQHRHLRQQHHRVGHGRHASPRSAAAAACRPALSPATPACRGCREGAPVAASPPSAPRPLGSSAGSSSPARRPAGWPSGSARRRGGRRCGAGPRPARPRSATRAAAGTTRSLPALASCSRSIRAPAA